MEKTFVSRHPIYESHVNLLAYELQSQNRVANGNGPIESEAIKADLSTFSDVGLDHIAGDHLAFVNVSREAVLGGHCDALSKQRVVLEVLRDIVFDESLRDGLGSLAARGYKIAIPNPLVGDDAVNLASVADIVRVDVSETAEAELGEHLELLSKLSVTLLAENIDTYEKFDLCKRFNFDYFQGFFFCTPKAEHHDVPVNRLAAVRVLAELQDPEISINKLERTISNDLSLSYKLLRYANSAYIGLTRQVESIGHAAKMVGIERIRLWASLLAFAKMEDKPRELMITAIVRGAMCERLAASTKEARKEMFFTVGLLSVLDALLDCPMEEALGELPLADEIRKALLRSEGAAGDALGCVLAYERSQWHAVEYKDLGSMTIRGHYLDSLGWARRISEGLMI